MAAVPASNIISRRSKSSSDEDNNRLWYMPNQRRHRNVKKANSFMDGRKMAASLSMFNWCFMGRLSTKPFHQNGTRKAIHFHMSSQDEISEHKIDRWKSEGGSARLPADRSAVFFNHCSSYDKSLIAGLIMIETRRWYLASRAVLQMKQRRSKMKRSE
jgi:hypothetical protein